MLYIMVFVIYVLQHIMVNHKAQREEGGKNVFCNLGLHQSTCTVQHRKCKDQVTYTIIHSII